MIIVVSERNYLKETLETQAELIVFGESRESGARINLAIRPNEEIEVVFDEREVNQILAEKGFLKSHRRSITKKESKDLSVQ